MEIYFSGLKRTMGEVIKAVRPDYIAQEIALKVAILQDHERDETYLLNCATHFFEN